MFSTDELSRVVKKINVSTIERVEKGRRNFAIRARLHSALGYAAMAFGGVCASMVMWFGYPVLGGLLALVAGALAGRALRRFKYYAEYAKLLVPLTNQEYEAILELADTSNVVHEALKDMTKKSRLLYQADYIYARALVVREARFGALPSDRLPLEQTRGLLAPA